MRRMMALVFILTFLLVACGGNAPEPTQQASTDVTPPAEPLTNTPEAAATALDQAGLATMMSMPERIYEVGQPTMPPPGQIISTATTPDPDAGLIFDVIRYRQTGGGETLEIEVRSDGTVTRNGATSTITQDQIIFIDNLLDQMNYYGIQGVFTAPGTSPDVFRYRITVDRAGSSMTIDAHDGFVPPELRELFVLLSGLGGPSQ
jgi:hypothetical protein